MANVARLTLVADAGKTIRGFEDWLEALTTEADELDWGWLLPQHRLAFRHLRASPPRLRTEFSAGAQTGSAIVQINEPRVAGTENPLAGIALDEAGRRYLVRQGELHDNPVSARIKGDEFKRLTGLTPVDLVVAGRTAKRVWYVVTELDGASSARIAARTADFVDRCSTARMSAASGAQDVVVGTLADEERFGNDESGGSTTIDIPAHQREIVRRQGYVWAALYDLTTAAGIVMRKPGHSAGFEVDAEILTEQEAFLMEIKSTAKPSDVYAGVGQLTLYPRLMPRLAKHQSVLLLPGTPSAAIAAAVRATGMQLHGFELTLTGSTYSVRFSRSFLDLLGI